MHDERKLAVDLRRVAFEKNANISKIARKTGISRTTITALYHQRSAQVSLSVLERLCNYLQCGVGEVLVMK